MARPGTFASATTMPGLACSAALGAVFLYALHFYPLEHSWLLPILLLYIALLCWRPDGWLFALPATLPMLDLAPWTGWFFFEEIDLLLLVTAAFAYWRLATRSPLSPPGRLPRGAAIGIGLLTLAYLAGTAKGLLPLPALDANAFNNYLSSYNSLRIAKAWLWALILLPPLLNHPARQIFIPGMLTGLGLVALATLWERTVFPGLSNLSSDYRTTAPFSGMHTGGAALDGYLALSLPLLLIWLLVRPARWRNGAALALLVLGVHAALTTFSRGLYAGLAASALLIAFFQLALRLRLPGLRRTRLVAGAGFALLVWWALQHMFATSGYRGLLAAIMLLAAACLLAGMDLPRRLLPASVLSGSAALVLPGLLMASLPHAGSGWLKPPYLLFIVSTLLLAAVIGRAWLLKAPWPRGAAAVALMAFSGMACCTVWIAWHRAGAGALWPALLAVALALLLLSIKSAGGAPWWTIRRGAVTGLAAGMMLLMLVIPISASYYATERFSSSAGDLRGRLRHWSQVLAMMDDGWPTALTGMGLGTFPATYFWRNQQHDLPGRLQYVDQPGNRYLRLDAPGYSHGYGELLRLLQHVSLQPHTPYLLALDVRRTGLMPVLQIRLCQRLLLYPQNCVDAPLRLLPPDGHWHRYQMTLDSAVLGSGSWWRRAPVQLEVAAAGGPDGGSIDIDNLSLLDTSGQHQLISNGNFSHANDYWFFSSDHHHLPWHAKNFALNLYFEMGWPGLLAMTVLLAATMRHLIRLARQRCTEAIACLAALGGFLVVGLFDSLLDVPRIGLLFFLLLLYSLLLPPSKLKENPP
ncbi:hypothetical protein [Janthinobacterium agaricidamnosum]|uniref:Putative membrane protein n=1 Tax=Janthinobacterium agaricidamnosum NBRC 102515 = DSM 9628 TaxID=1349767 RepID=W0V6L5_9BURK|nr:hypothetical protein [Janthinobacterium agaricidamnosum]CDG83260.1 putative membrane protein [Janthinobacterium agaricidamnosum NBRC 102515 = DSM 9628]